MFSNRNYFEYKSHKDIIKMLLIEEFLNKIKPYLKGLKIFENLIGGRFN